MVSSPHVAMPCNAALPLNIALRNFNPSPKRMCVVTHGPTPKNARTHASRSLRVNLGATHAKIVGTYFDKPMYAREGEDTYPKKKPWHGREGDGAHPTK